MGRFVRAPHPAQEARFKTAIITDGSFAAASHVLPELDLVNYVPRVKLPLLMINEDADFIFPVETAEHPFFDRLGTPAGQKRTVTFPGGHYVIAQQRHQVGREILDWLNRYLGTVDHT